MKRIEWMKKNIKGFASMYDRTQKIKAEERQYKLLKGEKK